MSLRLFDEGKRTRTYKARIDWGAGCGCLVILLNIAITIGIFYATAHFIIKFW